MIRICMYLHWFGTLEPDPHWNQWLQKLYSRTGSSHLMDTENGDVKEICGEDN